MTSEVSVQRDVCGLGKLSTSATGGTVEKVGQGEGAIGCRSSGVDAGDVGVGRVRESGDGRMSNMP